MDNEKNQEQRHILISSYIESRSLRLRMHLTAMHILKCLRISQGMVTTRSFHATGVNMDILWRQNRRLSKNPTSEGPLTDLPDYSYIDGRPAQLGGHQTRRLNQQRQNAAAIALALSEMEYAKQLCKEKRAAVENERKQLLAGKLKPKGNLLKPENPAAVANERNQILAGKMKPKGNLRKPRKQK